MTPILPSTQIDTETTRVRTPRDGLHRITFESPDIAMLASPTSCVNDICINGCIPILFAALEVPDEHPYAVFSTFDLLRASSDDENLWRVTRHTKFWTKDVWIIPIHRPSSAHWVLCLAHITHRELRLFDSLAEKTPWHADVDVCSVLYVIPPLLSTYPQNIMKLIFRLSSIAKRMHPETQLDFENESWTARPTLVSPIPHDSLCALLILEA